MSSLAQSGISISKKLLAHSREPSYHKTVCFYHKATQGQTVIDIENLVMPDDIVGILQASPEDLVAMGLFYNRKNLQLHSLSRGDLMLGVDFIVENSKEIKLIGGMAAGADQDEVFFGRMLAVPHDSIDTLIERLERKPSVVVTGSNIDWSMGYIFIKETDVDTTFTFSNEVDGRVITLSVKNIGATDINLTLPAGLWRDEGIELIVEPGRKNVYTFIKEGAETTCSYISRTTNL